MKYRLTDIAQVIRSKNAGPYELTLDVIFRDALVFQQVVEAKLITKEVIAALYKIPEEQVLSVVAFTPAKAIKATLVRTIPSGSLGDTDVYGAQQHAPLLGLELELETVLW